VLILSRKSTQRQEFADNWRFRPVVAATAKIAVDDKLWQRLLADHRKAISREAFSARRHHVALARSMRTANALDVADGSAISSAERSLACVRAFATHDCRVGRNESDGSGS